MKRVIVALFCFTYIILFGQWSTAAEHVKNGLMNSGFEEAKEGKPNYWKFFGPSKALILDGDTYFEGKHSIQIFLQQHSKDGVRLQQEVEVEAAKRYDIGGFIKSALADGFAQMLVIFLDKKRGEIETFTLPKISKKKNWVYQSTWVKSPNGADVAKIICLVQGSGKAWFDDIHFTTKLRGGY